MDNAGGGSVSNYDVGLVLTSGILILLPFLRCLAKASMNSLDGTSLTFTLLVLLIKAS
jgi:hypothetical protein